MPLAIRCSLATGCRRADWTRRDRKGASGLLPAPNQTGIPDTVNGRVLNNYLSAGSNGTVDNQFTLRGDHSIGGAARLSGRWTRFSVTNPSGPIIPGPLDSRVGDSLTTGNQASLSWTHIWSPSIITEGFAGFQRNNPQISPPSLGINVRETLGIERSSFAATPIMNISGWRSMGIDVNTYRRQIDNNYQSSFAMTRTTGAHTVKTGFQMRKNQFNVFNPGGNFAGVYSFNGELSSPTRNAGNGIQAMSDFLQGLIATANYDLPQPITGRRNTNLGVFVQDDWKVNRKLTLNIGLRYEYESPMTMSNDIYSMLDIVTGKLLVAGQNASRSLNLEAAKRNFAPRVGFAYSWDAKTVIRAGSGRVFCQIFSNLGGVVLYPGFTVAQAFPDLGVGVAQPFRLQQGMPQIAVQNLTTIFVERNATINNPLNSGAQFGQINPMPRSYQWNFGIQREVVRGTVMDVSYVGTRGNNLPLSLAFNPIPFARGEELARIGTAAANQQARRLPLVGNLGSFVHAGTSSYHSLQIKAAKQFSQSFGWNATYTYAKSIDDGTGLFSFSQPNDVDGGQFPNFFRRLDRARSNFDRPHALAASIQYKTSGPIWLRGFTISPILIARNGLPDTITQSNLWPGVGQQRPFVVGTDGEAESGDDDAGGNGDPLPADADGGEFSIPSGRSVV